MRSHPSRVRGLKLSKKENEGICHSVRTLSRVRGIETIFELPLILLTLVAPFTGAWMKLPNWERWKAQTNVAPFTGAWIEKLPGRRF